MFYVLILISSQLTSYSFLWIVASYFSLNSASFRPSCLGGQFGVGRERGGLYFLQRIDEKSALASFTRQQRQSNVLSSFNLWHYRLGHSSVSRMLFLHEFVPNLANISSKNLSFHQCTICPCAKQKRMPFSNNNHVDDFPFDLIHWYKGTIFHSYH